MIERLGLFVINLFFPPIAVYMICGFGTDLLVNCFLLILAVIPAHLHGFYISCTYFHRKNKVEKGRYPGGPKTFIESPNVINGGTSEWEALQLKNNEISRRGNKGSRT